MRQVLRPLLAILLLAGAAASGAEHAGAGALLAQTRADAASLAQAAAELDAAAASSCAPEDAALRASYHELFDRWLALSHLQFGPMEQGQLRYEIAFWPDPRSKTAKTLSRLVAKGDAAALEPDRFAKASVAAKGIYALEHLLYDERLQGVGDGAYRCALLRAVASDLQRTTRELAARWRDYAAADAELVRGYFKSLVFGLEQAVEVRLGAPLGTIERPRPQRAEARRSQRSLRNIAQSLASLQAVAAGLSAADPQLGAELDQWFAKAREQLARIDDPALAGVAEPAKRFRLETLGSTISSIIFLCQSELGPKLGVSAGFNAADGD